MGRSSGAPRKSVSLFPAPPWQTLVDAARELKTQHSHYRKWGRATNSELAFIAPHIQEKPSKDEKPHIAWQYIELLLAGGWSHKNLPIFSMPRPAGRAQQRLQRHLKKHSRARDH